MGSAFDRALHGIMRGSRVEFPISEYNAALVHKEIFLQRSTYAKVLRPKAVLSISRGTFWAHFA